METAKNDSQLKRSVLRTLFLEICFPRPFRSIGYARSLFVNINNNAFPMALPEKRPSDRWLCRSWMNHDRDRRSCWHTIMLYWLLKESERASRGPGPIRSLLYVIWTNKLTDRIAIHNDQRTPRAYIPHRWAVALARHIMFDNWIEISIKPSLLDRVNRKRYKLCTLSATRTHFTVRIIESINTFTPDSIDGAKPGER